MNTPTNDTGRPIPAGWKPATRDGLCCNRDGNPVHYPSKVLCRACFKALDAKMEALLSPRKAPDAGGEGT
jgi:hypothetical protein